ncbi:hypothetical protein BGZ61DRAFT_465568 [Ilyonectria robusta]|uniref:uncharacterized protein n=1 Tax=Ilyonectria robusta TaxID=1079257 RepID=UPI001E8CEE67|nr:uncharacterized protein BGZ61DRAFT_465568 [Ilyonectria robusta]KAH8658989.1 hypothetical protein BGZ61DRAFT_465568 [Ilyonectria robusta]
MEPFPSHGCPHAKSSCADACQADAEARKQQKRAQNRVNQRAHRMRLRAKEAEAPPGPRPYRIYRWRWQFPEQNVPETGYAPTEVANAAVVPSSLRPSPAGELQSMPLVGVVYQGWDNTAISAESDSSHHVEFPLSADHFLHLIRYNVFRGLISIKTMLNLLTIKVDGPFEMPAPPHTTGPCWGHATIYPVHPGIPNCLLPTTSQMSRPHSFWIDMIPFPQLRDNLITWEASFNHLEFLYDLVGSLLNSTSLGQQGAFDSLATSSQLIVREDDTDELTAGRQGLIVWGEPHEKENWEVTPGFFNKWAYVLEGCEELVNISNRWRIARGEEPLQLDAPRAL